jgi:hypothetical protein
MQAHVVAVPECRRFDSDRVPVALDCARRDAELPVFVLAGGRDAAEDDAGQALS